MTQSSGSPPGGPAPSARSVPPGAAVGRGAAIAGRRAAAWTGLYAALLAALLVAPVLLPGHPPLVDYPNHLARMVIAFAPSEALAEHYVFAWRNMSNLGLEIAMAGLVQLLPVETAMQVFVALTALATLGGALALAAALHGRVPLAAGMAALFVWGGALQFGFLSYCLGIAVALWTLAGWIALDRRRGWQLTLGFAAAVALYYIHILALGAYALLVAGLEIDRLLRGRGAGLGRALVSALQFAAPAALFLAGRQGGGAAEIHFAGPRTKLIALQRLFWDEGPALSLLALALLAVLVALALRRGQSPVAPRMLPGLALLALAVAVFPAGIILGGTPNWALDWRYLTPLALAGAAALRDPPAGRAGLVLLAAAVLALTAGRTGVMAAGSWRAGAAQEREIRACFAALPEGARMAALPLPMSRQIFNWPQSPPPVLHLPAFAVVDRAAFVPSLFAYSDQQPLRYRPQGEALRDRLGTMQYVSPDRFDRARLEGIDHLLILTRPGDRADAHAAALPIALGPPLCAGRFGLYPIAAAAP